MLRWRREGRGLGTVVEARQPCTAPGKAFPACNGMHVGRGWTKVVKGGSGDANSRQGRPTSAVSGPVMPGQNPICGSCPVYAAGALLGCGILCAMTNT